MLVQHLQRDHRFCPDRWMRVVRACVGPALETACSVLANGAACSAHFVTSGRRFRAWARRHAGHIPCPVVAVSAGHIGLTILLVVLYMVNGETVN